MTGMPASPNGRVPTRIAEALDLLPVSADVFLTKPASSTDRRGLYGGQLAAQALQAAVHTVSPDRLAHSLHSYFLRPGDARAPVQLRVHCDRDGRQYSTRRVLATQNGATIMHLAASFQTPQPGPDFQATTIPEARDPDTLPAFSLDERMLDLEARVPHDPGRWHRWPARLWLRVRDLPDAEPNTHACALTFLSDMCTGLSKAPRVEQAGVLPSLDHSIWLHRPARTDDWVLLDLQPESTASGRGMYTGRLYDRRGRLIASLAQESLFRLRPKAEHLPHLSPSSETPTRMSPDGR